MTPTFRAMQVASEGQLELVERDVPSPGAGDVLIAVEACGVCGADRSDIEKADPATRRIPGHEIVGRITAMGTNVPDIWEIGQRVGVGRFGGPCLQCAACRSGRLHLCRNQPVMGADTDGGYAEMVVARASGLVAIPPELSSSEAAPILCAGIATFNALKTSGATAGDTVAVFGIGGLGHMAVQYARQMGFRVVAIGRGQDIAADAQALGAHHYVDADQDDAVEALNDMGGATAILTTVGDAQSVSNLLGGLALGGRLMLLGIGPDPLAVSMGQVVGGERGVAGSLTGSPFEIERTLDFSVLSGVRPQIETIPFEQANEAYLKMKTGAAKFRMVLTMESDADAHQ